MIQKISWYKINYKIKYYNYLFPMIISRRGYNESLWMALHNYTKS
eukprot:SAG11_NODE_31553_length_291_cov_0.458333_1_plen_44_part_01